MWDSNLSLTILDRLDSALLRPGRIDREFPPPGPEAHVAILRIRIPFMQGMRSIHVYDLIEPSLIWDH